MNWKKTVSFICAVSVMGVSLAGCGDNSQSTKGKENADGESKENDGGMSGTLTIWEHGYGFEASLQQIIEGFQKKYQDVEVEYEIKDGDNYYSLLSTAIQSGEGPDIFWTNGTATANMKDYVSNEVCMDLTDKVDYSLFGEDAMKLTEVDGKNYSVPWLTMDTRAVYYNKDIFEENGWEVPEKFSEFEELLEKIKKAGYTPISLSGVNVYSLLFTFEPILSAMDVEYTKGLSDYSVKATGKPAADALNKMLEWADKGYFGDNWLGVADNNAQTLAFTSGEAVMDIAGSWEAATISENNPNLNYGAFEIPSEEGIRGMVGTPANGFSVNTATENEAAAVAFMNYCASLDAQTVWVQSQGAVSASDEIEASTEIAKEISESGAGNIYTSWQSVLVNHSTDGTAVSLWDEDFTKIFSGDITAEEFMDNISKVMQ